MTADKLDSVRTWLLARAPEAGDLGLDLDLIDARVVDSLAFTEFLLFLESLVDRELVLDGESVMNLRTLRGIRDHVLYEAEPRGGPR
jgi:acyl carrier protein